MEEGSKVVWTFFAFILLLFAVLFI